MAINNISLTSMHHTTLTDLSYYLDDNISVTGSDGSFETYTSDSFRRLYNDAVESMNTYRTLAESYRDKYLLYYKLYEDLAKEIMDN